MYRKIRQTQGADQWSNCIGCSQNNPIGLHLKFYANEEGELVATWNPSENYTGWSNVVHGGIQGLIMDEAASWWVRCFRQVAATTQKMEIKYLKPVLVSDGEVRVKITHTKDIRNFVQMKAELYNGKGVLCDTADIVYYQYSEKDSVEKFGFTRCEYEEGEGRYEF